LPEECQVLQLVCGKPVNLKQVSSSPYHAITVPNRYRFVCHADTVYGTQAYMIRQACARRLLQEEHSVRAPIDALLFDWRYNFYLPWIIYKKNKKMLGVHEVRIGSERPIGYSPIWSTKFAVRVRRRLVYITGKFVRKCILRWIWPWNQGRKISLLQFKGEPRILQYARIIHSFYVTPD